MSWDGIYRSKHHYDLKDGKVACKRRFVKVKTFKKESVSCFACMKAMGWIK